MRMRQILSSSIEIQLSHVSLIIPSKNQRIKFTLAMPGANYNSYYNLKLHSNYSTLLFCTLMYVHVCNYAHTHVHNTYAIAKESTCSFTINNIACKAAAPNYGIGICVGANTSKFWWYRNHSNTLYKYQFC